MWDGVMCTRLVWLMTGTGGCSCEISTEPSGSIKYWKTIPVLATRDLSSTAQLHGVSY
jgi:hypothetical protein